MNNIFLAIGPDEFLLSEFLNSYKKAALQKYGEFSVDSFSFGEKEFLEIRNDIFSPPFFGEKRIIFLEDFPPSSTARITEKQKSQYISFINELSGLPDNIVLLCSNSNPDKRTTIYKNYKKISGKIFEHPSFNPKKDSIKYSQWIQSRAKKYGSNISSENADFLRNFSGSNLRSLDAELKKLSIYKFKSEILKQDILDLSVPSEDVGDFSFSNAMYSGNITNILNELSVLSEKYDIAMVFNRDILPSFRNILKGKLSLEFPSEKSEIHPFILNKIKKTLSTIPLKTILKTQEELTKIDVMSKTGELSLSGNTTAFLLYVEKIIYDLFTCSSN